MNERDFALNKSEIINIDSLMANETKLLYMKLVFAEDIKYPNFSFNPNFNFEVQELDSKGSAYGDSYKDSYGIEKKVEIKFSDLLCMNNNVQEDSISDIWADLSENDNFDISENKLKLPYPNIKKAGQEISKLLGMLPLNSLDNLDKLSQKFEFFYYYNSCYKTSVSDFIMFK